MSGHDLLNSMTSFVTSALYGFCSSQHQFSARWNLLPRNITQANWIHHLRVILQCQVKISDRWDSTFLLGLTFLLLIDKVVIYIWASFCILLVVLTTGRGAQTWRTQHSSDRHQQNRVHSSYGRLQNKQTGERMKVLFFFLIEVQTTTRLPVIYYCSVSLYQMIKLARRRWPKGLLIFVCTVWHIHGEYEFLHFWSGFKEGRKHIVWFVNHSHLWNTLPFRSVPIVTHFDEAWTM